MDLDAILRGLPLQDSFFFSSAVCAIIIASFIVSILIAIWVYRDAESRGMSGVLWLLVVLVAGLLGLLIYLIVRTDHPVLPRGYYPPAYPAYPAYPGYYPPAYPPAGAPVSPPSPPTSTGASVMCKSCGTTSPAGVTFCRQCGAKL